MTLRPEFNVPAIDEMLVVRLAALAAEIDGARPGEWEETLEEFNRLSPCPRSFDDFQGIYGGEEHPWLIVNDRLWIESQTWMGVAAHNGNVGVVALLAPSYSCRCNGHAIQVPEATVHSEDSDGRRRLLRSSAVGHPASLGQLQSTLAYSVGVRSWVV